MSIATGEQNHLTQSLERMESLLAEIEERGDPDAQARVAEIIRTLLAFHTEGLRRILSHLARADPNGPSILAALADDDLVSNLLVLHGLHPRDLESRVRGALDQVRPLLGAHGGRVELVGVSDDAYIHLRLEGNCHGCPSSRATLTGTIEEAVYAAAPEAAGIRVEGLVEEAAPAGPAGFVPISEVTILRDASADANNREGIACVKEKP